MNRISLPRAAAFVPPPAPPVPPAPPSPPQGTAGGDCEYFAQTVNTPRGQRELTIYATQKPWRGIDVYLATRIPVPLSSVFTVRVFAIVGGIRALVRTGRYNFVAGTGVAPTVLIPPQLVCAARSGAVKYEVTLSWNADVGVNADQPVEFAIYASNDLTVEPPKYTGAPIPFSGNNVTQWDTTSVGGVLYPEAEIRQIVAFNAAAAARFVLLIETDPATVVGAGFAATMTFPIGAVAGEGQTFDNVDYRVRPGRRMRIFASSTALTLTAVADASFTLRVA